MASYSAPRTAINSSLRELTEIFRWVYDREGYGNSPITVLIGGWAVYSYNQWYGSVDIDIVTNNKTRQDLMWYLRNDRGFVPQRDAMAPTTVVKDVPEGKILIDFGSREDIYRFEGRIDECPFSLLDGHTQMREIGAGFPVIVPEQTLLIIFKLKAAWDRSFRIQNKTSNDEEWERGKLRKDHADILALIDPEIRGTEVDIQYLGEMLHDYPFLVEILREIADDTDAINMYRRMSPEKARASIENLLLLAL
ncbi:MAG TPA: hypothetical protein PKK68_05350 [Methanothrix soehngenii]|nr:hypothetical protein [Methanothrix soehngenii]